MDSSNDAQLGQRSLPARPTIVSLDQNKWIDLARAVAAPKDHPRRP